MPRHERGHSCSGFGFQIANGNVLNQPITWKKNFYWKGWTGRAPCFQFLLQKKKKKKKTGHGALEGKGWDVEPSIAESYTNLLQHLTEFNEQSSGHQFIRNENMKMKKEKKSVPMVKALARIPEGPGYLRPSGLEMEEVGSSIYALHPSWRTSGASSGLSSEAYFS